MVIYLKPISSEELQERVFKMIKDDKDFAQAQTVFDDKKFGKVVVSMCEFVIGLSFRLMDGPTQRSNAKI